jgi:hypothetical protein
MANSLIPKDRHKGGVGGTGKQIVDRAKLHLEPQELSH